MYGTMGPILLVESQATSWTTKRRDVQDPSEVEDPFERNEEIYMRNSGNPVRFCKKAVGEQGRKPRQPEDLQEVGSANSTREVAERPIGNGGKEPTQYQSV